MPLLPICRAWERPSRPGARTTMNTILSAWTVVVLLLFLGITCWAWSGRKKKDFDKAARIPFEEDDDGNVLSEDSD